MPGGPEVKDWRQRNGIEWKGKGREEVVEGEEEKADGEAEVVEAAEAAVDAAVEAVEPVASEEISSDVLSTTEDASMLDAGSPEPQADDIPPAPPADRVWADAQVNVRPRLFLSLPHLFFFLLLTLLYPPSGPHSGQPTPTPPNPVRPNVSSPSPPPPPNLAPPPNPNPPPPPQHGPTRLPPKPSRC